ncbi:MAG: type II toxin-antitoxin system RelE/ParE family toxin [Sphingomonas sp.]
MPRLIWSPASRGDLHDIDGWLTERNPAAAARILRAIRVSSDRLRDYPRIGRAIDRPFRVLAVRTTKYLLVYRLHNDVVEIIRVRHAAETWLPVEGEI